MSGTMSKTNNSAQNNFDLQLSNTLSSISNLQNMEYALFGDLEKLSASPDLNTDAVQTKVQGIINQIDEITKMRKNLFETIETNYNFLQENINDQRKVLADQFLSLNIIESQLEQTRKTLEEKRLIKSNANRMVQINSYYSSRYEAYSNVLRYVVYACILIIIVILIMKVGFFTENIASILIIIILAIAIIYIGGMVYDISRRTNYDFDKYNYPFDPNNVPSTTPNMVDKPIDEMNINKLIGYVCKNSTTNAAATPTSDTSATSATSNVTNAGSGVSATSGTVESFALFQGPATQFKKNLKSLQTGCEMPYNEGKILPFLSY